MHVCVHVCKNIADLANVDLVSLTKFNMYYANFYTFFLKLTVRLFICNIYSCVDKF